MALQLAPRILIAEDHEDTLEALEWLLRKEGFRVVGVRNGLDALREMHTAAPDVLLVDLEMPWVSGWDVLTHMAQDPALRRIPTVVVSGHISDQRTPRDVIALVKPVDPDRLLAAVLALTGEPMHRAASLPGGEGERDSPAGPPTRGWPRTNRDGDR